MSEEELLKGLEGLTPPESQPEPDSDVGDEEEVSIVRRYPSASAGSSGWTRRGR